MSEASMGPFKLASEKFDKPIVSITILAFLTAILSLVVPILYSSATSPTSCAPRPTHLPIAGTPTAYNSTPHGKSYTSTASNSGHNTILRSDQTYGARYAFHQYGEAADAFRPAGTNVYSPFAGHVLHTEALPDSAGDFTVVESDDYCLVAVLAHLVDAPDAGSNVRNGELIGTLYALNEGAHLHFELLVAGTPINEGAKWTGDAKPIWTAQTNYLTTNNTAPPPSAPPYIYDESADDTTVSTKKSACRENKTICHQYGSLVADTGDATKDTWQAADTTGDSNLAIYGPWVTIHGNGGVSESSITTYEGCIALRSVTSTSNVSLEITKDDGATRLGGRTQDVSSNGYSYVCANFLNGTSDYNNVEVKVVINNGKVRIAETFIDIPGDSSGAAPKPCIKCPIRLPA